MPLRILTVGLTLAAIPSGSARSSGLFASIEGELDPLCGPGSVREVAIDVEETREGTRLTWPAEAAFRTDLVRGSLGVLALTQGDFRKATGLCLRDDIPDVDPVVVYDLEVPEAGDGYWYLVRSDQYAGCPVAGANDYNSLNEGQVGFRNVEIRMSGHDCACYYPCDDP